MKLKYTKTEGIPYKPFRNCKCFTSLHSKRLLPGNECCEWTWGRNCWQCQVTAQGPEQNKITISLYLF